MSETHSPPAKLLPCAEPSSLDTKPCSSKKRRLRSQKRKRNQITPRSLTPIAHDVHSDSPDFDSDSDSSAEEFAEPPAAKRQREEEPRKQKKKKVRHTNRIRPCAPLPASTTIPYDIITPERLESFKKTLKYSVSDELYERLEKHIPNVITAVKDAYKCRYRIEDNENLFQPWARQRDADNTPSHSAANPPNPIRFKPEALPQGTRLLDNEHGFFIVDKAGVPLVFVIRGLIPEDIHNEMISLGSRFSKDFQQKGGQHCNKFKSVPGGGDFQNCQAHFGIWDPVSQDHHPPVVSADTRENHELWHEFFQHPCAQFVLHTMNLVLECLDPGYVDGLKVLNEKLAQTKNGGEYLKYNPCYINGLAVHYNQDGCIHYDCKCLHSGWDLVQAFGRYFGCIMQLRDLKTNIKFNPVDLMGIRASLAHGATDWEGDGRMVLAPFIE